MVEDAAFGRKRTFSLSQAFGGFTQTAKFSHLSVSS
jgi:hypothetical protein